MELITKELQALTRLSSFPGYPGSPYYLLHRARKGILGEGGGAGGGRLGGPSL